MPSVKPHRGGAFRVQVAKVGRPGKVIRVSKVLETEFLTKVWGLRLEQGSEEGRSDVRHTLAEALDAYAQRESSTMWPVPCGGGSVRRPSRGTLATWQWVRLRRGTSRPEETPGCAR